MKKKNLNLLIISLIFLTSCQFSDNVVSNFSSTFSNTSNEISISKSETTLNETTSKDSSAISSSDLSTTSNTINSTSSQSSSYSSLSYNTSFSSNYNGSYYESINLNLKQNSLIAELGDLLASTHTTKSYNDLWDGYILGDIKPGTNYLWDMYSNCNFDAYNPPKGNYKKEGDAVNREHSIPQSWFNEASPMKSDYYHVVPTDGYVNNRRSNYPFAEVDDDAVKYTSSNGSKLGTSSGNNISGTVFEPIDEYKGDFARIYFYMATRYYTKVGTFSGGVFKSGYPYLNSNYLNLYLKWAKEDPVSDKEIQRNEGGYVFQGNRNPYVDYPELLFKAFDENYVESIDTDQDKANEIIALIESIGNVTLNSNNAITKAREAYNNASSEVKALVSNYQVLEEAEEEYQNLLNESSSTTLGAEIVCTFTDLNFANNLDYVFSCDATTNGFENERGVQFLRTNDVTLSTSSYNQSINKITIVTSSNSSTYTFQVSIDGTLLDSETNTINNGDKNVSLVFSSTTNLTGEVSIHITSSTKNKSLWIKSIGIN